jgi:hypothetical protein
MKNENYKEQNKNPFARYERIRGEGITPLIPNNGITLK